MQLLRVPALLGDGARAAAVPGVLVEWSRRGEDGQEGAGAGAGWFGRVVYAVVDDGRVVLVRV